jgi:hypothetical protein
VSAAENILGTDVVSGGMQMPSSGSGATLFSGWGESLAAVVAGNLVYFLARPLLPAVLQHELFHLDVGLFVDFLCCGVALVLIRRVRREDKSVS